MVKTYKSAPDNNQTARVSSPSQSEQMSTELGLYKIVVRFPCGLQRECVRSYHIQPNHDVIQTNYMACNRGKQSCVTQDSRLGLDVGGLGPKMREALKSQALDSEKRILQTIKGLNNLRLWIEIIINYNVSNLFYNVEIITYQYKIVM
ncbi:Hypothetical_protein [Hexamita inflata]|uniref:Hypothetical_protein n=1 Tax=Hexamita inflata TaxID=28002 RepID=A0AA86PHN4_9EUKA|nr:Hypothetical protein HINF_LOCUS23677 [Hexamita inflata]